MANQNLITLIKLIRNIDPIKFSFYSYAQIGEQYIRLKDLTKEMFNEPGFTADPSGYYVTYINPEADILDLESEFELTRNQYRTLFTNGGTIIDKNDNKFVVNYASAPNEWADAAQVLVDGGRVYTKLNAK